MTTPETQLMDAIAADSYRDVVAALTNGANPNITDADGDGPLRWAAGRAGNAVIEALISWGTDVNSRCLGPDGAPGHHVLHTLAAVDAVEQIEMLAAAGAVIDARSAGVGATPLMYAAGNGNAAAVAALIRLGADIDAVDADGDSALAAAASRGRDTAVRALLAAGANPNLGRNVDGHTPLTLAALQSVHGVPGATAAGNLLFGAGADLRPMYQAGYCFVDGRYPVAFRDALSFRGRETDFTFGWRDERVGGEALDRVFAMD